MSFVQGEKLLELVIRVATQDLIENISILKTIFYKDKRLNEGYPIQQVGGGVRPETLVMDRFQAKLSTLPRRESEVGMLDIFANGFLDADKVHQYLMSANIAIKHGYPRNAQDIPCIAILLGSENEEQYIGQQGIEGTPYLGAPEETQKAALADSSYNIIILTTNYEETLVWYNIIKYALLEYRDILEAYGLQAASTSWQDVEPAAEYLQSGLFIYQRNCVFNTKKVDTIEVAKQGFIEEPVYAGSIS